LLTPLGESETLREDIELVRELMGRHCWKPETISEVEAALAAIDTRRTDRNLYLGVVGEFSSGKSTFLNAVMRDDLLRTDVLQATTAAVTWMRYGEEIDVEVEFVDGAVNRFSAHRRPLWQRFKDFLSKPTYETQKNRLRAFIHEVTANEEVASRVRNVTIYHPAEAFRRGLVICDTPGANAENPRHVEVSARALLEHCDAAIVVIPADIPVSESLLKFLREHLTEAAHRCIYLVTKLDLIRRERERDHLLQTIDKRLASGLGVDSVKSVACAPRLVVDVFTGERGNLDDECVRRMVGEFEKVQERIWSTLEGNREIIQLDRLSLLMSRLLVYLPDQLSMLEETYRQQHQALHDNRIQNLAEFARNEKGRHVGEVLRRNSGARQAAVDIVCRFRDVSVDKMSTHIASGIQKTSKLKDFVEKDLPSEFQLCQAQLEEELLPIFRDIRKQAQAQVSVFERDFKVRYEFLATLGGWIESPRTNPTDQLSVSFREGPRKSMQDIAKAVREGNGASIGISTGAGGVGAAIGTLIAPGIGTAIGGALGWMAGKFLGPSLEDLKKEALEKISRLLETAFNEAIESVEDAVERTVSDAAQSMGEVIDHYVAQYDALINRMIARDEAQKTELTRKRQKIRQDQAQLQHRRQRIDRWRQCLKTATAGEGDA
ncbi:MAG: dynamin family protein, partial [Coriobacteriia bacterium]|nr:dynamin family protein [Coriobacteriia bacterium]